MGIEIRTMTPADYPGAAALWNAAPGMGLRALDDSEAGIAKYLRRNPTTSFVALQGGQLIGCILAGHDGRRGYIHHTAVAREYQGLGIGRALVEHALEALGREGIHKAALVVFADNGQGNGFWEKLGFTCREDLVYRNRSLNEENR